MALSREALPPEVFEAIATAPEEGEALAYKDKKSRNIAKARALVKW